jgi:F-type H+-transporting ATPase subunit delta
MVTSDLEETGRVSTSGGIQAGLAGRYATALFEQARDKKELDAVAASIAKLQAALAESADLGALIRNPVLSRQQAENAIEAVGHALAVDDTTSRFLGVVARNRRLAALAGMLSAFNQLLAQHRGEETAQVTSAHPLDEAQLGALKTRLRGRIGRDVAIETKVDPAILGGLVVQIGSQMIDGSIRTKLNTLAHAMKG